MGAPSVLLQMSEADFEEIIGIFLEGPAAREQFFSDPASIAARRGIDLSGETIERIQEIGRSFPPSVKTSFKEELVLTSSNGY